MQAVQCYILTVFGLLAMRGDRVINAEAEVAVLDGDTEIDRLSFSGKVGLGKEGCRRSYLGRPGLTAKLASGPGRIHFAPVLTPAA